VSLDSFRSTTPFQLPNDLRKNILPAIITEIGTTLLPLGYKYWSLCKYLQILIVIGKLHLAGMMFEDPTKLFMESSLITEGTVKIALNQEFTDFMEFPHFNEPFAEKPVENDILTCPIIKFSNAGKINTHEFSLATVENGFVEKLREETVEMSLPMRRRTILYRSLEEFFSVEARKFTDLFPEGRIVIRSILNNLVRTSNIPRRLFQENRNESYRNQDFKEIVTAVISEVKVAGRKRKLE
jgi:hypothetical protein